MGERVDDVRNILEAQPQNATLDTLRQQFSQYRTRDDGKWLQVLDQNGDWIYRSERIEAVHSTLPLLQENPHQHRTIQFKYATRHHSNRPGLALIRRISVRGRPYAVQTGLSQKTPHVPRSDRAREAIFEHLKARTEGWLLPSNRIPGKPLQRQSLNSVIRGCPTRQKLTQGHHAVPCPA